MNEADSGEEVENLVLVVVTGWAVGARVAPCQHQPGRDLHESLLLAPVGVAGEGVERDSWSVWGEG
jgi:hypothetical protein